MAVNAPKAANHECKIILQQIVCESSFFHNWTATCRCGWRMFGLKKECTLAIDEHGVRDAEHLMIGPKIIAEKWTVSIPNLEFPQDRWCWHAQNEGEDDPTYHGLGRSECEAIDDLHGINEVRRMARWDQSEGFPRKADWLEFFRYSHD